MKFHTTKKTIFISLITLIILSTFVLFFSFSIIFFNIDEPLILSSIITLEKSLGISIEVDSIETNMFTRISINGISVRDNKDEMIATFNSILLDTPWYKLLPRYILNQPIVITIQESVFTFKTSHQYIIDYFSNPINVNETLPFSLNVVFNDSLVTYKGEHELIKAIMPSLHVEVMNGELKNIYMAISQCDYEGKDFSLFAKDLLLEARVENTQDLAFSFSSGQFSILSELLFLNAQFDSSLFSYKGNIDDIKGNIEGLLIHPEVSYLDETLPLFYKSGQLMVNGSHSNTTIDTIILRSSDYIIAQSDYSLVGDLFTFEYDDEENKLGLTLNNESQFNISEEPFFFIDTLKAELSLGKDIDSFRLEGNSITLASSSMLEQLIGSSLIEKMSIEDPYLLISQRINEEEYVYETSGRIEGRTSFIAPQTIDFEFFSDGSIDESFAIKNIQASLLNVTSTLLSPIYTINAQYNENLEFPLVLHVKDQNKLSISLKRNIKKNENQLLFTSSNTSLYPYKDLIRLFAPVIPSYITEKTTISGELSLELDDIIQKGKVNASVAFQEIATGDNSINAASTILASINDKKLLVDLATITTTGVRLSYTGEIDRLTWLPKGVLEATDVTKGTSLAAVDFTLLENQEVGYTLTSSLISSLKIKGLARYASSFSFIKTNGIIDIFNESYLFESNFNNQLGIIDTSLPGLSLLIDLISIPGHLDISIYTDSFKIPLPRSSFIKEQTYLNGLLIADFSLSDNQFFIHSENVEITNISMLGSNNGVLKTNFTLNNSQFLLDNLLYTDNIGTLSGSIDIKKSSLLSLFSLEFEKFTMNAILKEDDINIIDVRLLPDEHNENYSIATLFINDFPLERISSSYKNTFASMSIAGVTDFSTIIDGEGRIEVSQDIENVTTGTVNFSINNKEISFYDGLIEKGNYSASNIRAILPYNGQLEASVDLLHKNAYVWRENNTKTSLSLQIPIERSEHVFDFLKKVPFEITNWNKATLSHSNTQFFGMVDMVDGTHQITRNENILKVSHSGKGSINATYNLNTNFLDIQANENFLFPLEGKGIFSSEYISMDLPYVALDLTYLNALFGEPVIDFETGLFEGNVLVEGPLSNPQYFGTMSSNRVTVSLYWTGEQKLSVLNPVITLGENVFNLPYTRAVVKKKDGRDGEGLFRFEMLFENWNISNYQLDAKINKGNVSIAIPVPQIPLYIEADANGEFGLIGTLTEEKIYGDITVPNGKIAFNIPELPAWFLPKTRTSVDLNFTSGKNITFVYPNEDSPIVSATVADNQKLSLSISSPSMATILQGDIALRSGEIYYIQENFYITEGSLVFPKGQVGNIEAAEPRINLRARLRKFDLEGNRIDIFLILQNDSLTSINPRFDSFPLRTNNEILQILGQNLLNTNFAENPDGGFQSVLSAASAATDVISRLGLIQGGGITFGFSSIIRQSLGLDVFSIRSNLLQNILIEAIPGMSNDVSMSPISRYLDNTTLYIGKYLLDELYLQGLLTFRRDFTGTRSSFLAEDLAIDTELSIEWLNDLATFSFFTQPEELSIFNLFDTIGFSITKNFEF